MTLQMVPPVTWVDDEEGMMRFVRHVRDTGECALDTETTGLDRRSDHVLFWSGAPDAESRYCFSRPMLEIYDRELSQDRNLKWYLTNQNFDFSMIANSGVRVPEGRSYCTLAMDWLHDENRQGRHGLKETAGDHIDLDMREFKEAFKRKGKESIQEVLLREMRDNPESARSYASLDAHATFRVFKHLKADLERQQMLDGIPLWDYFETTEMPFTRVLHNCCRRGIMIDVGYLDELSPKIQTDIDHHQKELNKLAGMEVNPRSPLQLRALFYDKLGLKPWKYTKGGTSGNRQPSTDVQVLNRWMEDGVEGAQLVQTIRGLSKMKGTYVDGLRKWVDDELRIHPTLTQHVTVTGRLSSVDPNLQNIPRPGTDKFGIRTAFMPKTDHVLLVIDYEQLEMRLMAHFSQEPNMIEVINKGWDIHAGTASLMFGHKYEDIIAAGKKKKAAAQNSKIVMTELEKDMCFSRQASKTIGFGLNYGEGPKKLAASLGITVDEAKELIKLYFQPYPGVQEFIKGTHSFIYDNYMVETILGRPRRFPEMEYLGGLDYWKMRGSEKSTRAQCERQAVNSVIQGSAADVAKMAMILCDEDTDIKALGADLLLQVHDELIFEVPEDNVKEVVPLILERMEHPFAEDLLVPLTADWGVGYSWASAKA